MTSRTSDMEVIFRLPKLLQSIAPAPTLAIQGLPNWLKEMPTEAQSNLTGRSTDTVKLCSPFIDAMTHGFLIPLICDIKVEAGEFTWDLDLPAGDDFGMPRAPLGSHDAAQVTGTPYFAADRNLIKFHNFWTISAPEGYSLLFMHPVHRNDLPFSTLTGLVDCDRYRDSWIHFPAHWHDVHFRGTLPKGTPIAQCIPIKRQAWGLDTRILTDDEALRTQGLTQEIRDNRGVYRKRFRA